MDQYFAVAAPGLEPLVAYELGGLGLLPHPAAEPGAGGRPPAEGSGGVTFTGELAGLYRANLHLRTASRVLVRLGDFYAKSFPELRKKAGRLAWDRYLSPGQPISLSVTCRKSRLYHSDAVAERVAGAVQDRLDRPSPQVKTEDEEASSPPQLIVVRLLHDHCTVSIDSSGALLHRRGYRQETAKAPLRETLAAAMLLAAGWDPTAPLLDPFCGSGTIPIEAALLAIGRPPGCSRRFAFMDWPSFKTETWQALLAGCQAEAGPSLPPILASDRDAGAIRIAEANAARAGVAELIQFSQRAVSAIEPPPGPGWVVTNPPYGLRVSAAHDLRNLYAQLGNVMREKCPGWHTAILSSDPRLLGQVGIPQETALATVNGGINVSLAVGQVPA